MTNRTQPIRWLSIILMLFAIAGCVRSEDAVEGDDPAAPVAGNPGTPPAGDAPADPTPPATPPGDEMPPEDEMPAPVDPNPPTNEPELTDVQIFEQTLFPPLRDSANFCVNCHGSFAQPLFAVETVNDAYNAVVGQQKVNLSNPAISRIYLRASEDRHNCGGDASCDAIGATFLAAITDWASQAAPADPPPAAGTAAVSAKTTFASAVEQAAARVDTNAIAKFLLDEGTGTTATDSSGNGAAITLNIQNMEWVDGGGLRNVSGKAQASVADSRKIFDSVNASKAFTAEAWLIADNTAQDGPARTVTFSQDTSNRNFTLGQNAIYWQMRNRSANTGANGTPALEALSPEVDTSLQHVVMTFDEASGRKIFINGQLSIEDNTPDTLDWQDGYQLVLGNETTDDRPWAGIIRFVAIHSAALTAAEVQQNYEAGLGNLTTLRFDVSEAVGAPAMIEMLAADIDGKGYLFAKPRYIGEQTGVMVKNMRIAVNDTIPIASQAFRRLDMEIDANGRELSPLGAVIPASLGAMNDEFHLVFETIGNATGTPEGVAPSAPPPARPDVDEPDFGVRSFSQLNDTMATLTGIDQNSNAIRNLYEELRGALPATSDLLSYSQPQQVAIQRLANGYCDAIVNNNGRCSALFGSCQVNAGDLGSVGNSVYDSFIGSTVANQPLRADVRNEISSLIQDLGCAGGCTGNDAQTVLAASCAAVLSSGAITIK